VLNLRRITTVILGGTPRRGRPPPRDIVHSLKRGTLRELHARTITFIVTTAPTTLHVVRAWLREMELSPTQKASLLGRDVTREGIAMQLGSYKARIIKRFFRADEFALMCG